MILALNFKNSKETNKFGIQLRATFSESFAEITGNFSGLRRFIKPNPSFVLSALILLMILGLWSIWS
jgi:hypothetical protein